jgi:hypothetical protein
MAACACCDATVLFGGTRVGDRRYCNAHCAARGPLQSVLPHVPQEAAREQALQIFRGRCPHCAGPGPVDVHAAHTIWSAVVLTSWQSTRLFACRACATKQQALAALKSLLLGWWGIPWGVLGTPITLGRNLYAMATHRNLRAPSAALLQQARVVIAARMIEQAREDQARAQAAAASHQPPPLPGA